MRLKIGPIIEQAEAARERIVRELPQHTGLASLAEATARVAREAERVSRKLQRPFGLHRLPVLFLGAALVLLLSWLYSEFIRDTTLKIALPDRDAQQLRNRVQNDQQRLKFQTVVVPGSNEGAQLVAKGEVDLAFVQGGIPIAEELPRLQTPNPELALWFVRERISEISEIRTVLTSSKGEGSHSVAKLVFSGWNLDSQIEYQHEWRQLSAVKDYEIPAEVDAVFVVKDVADEATLRGTARLADAGFRMQKVNLGARGERYPFLKPIEIPPGYFRTAPAIPAEATPTYAVATYLVGRRGLTATMLTSAGKLLDNSPPTLSASGMEPGLNQASELFQGLDAFLGILINIGLAFLALMGWEMLAYRRQFHELNSLISLISVHQSSKDVLAVADPSIRKNNLAYLSLCSDLLGLISMIAGYYTQENSSLLFNSLPEIIHQRCDGLKINIQLKILHATIG